MKLVALYQHPEDETTFDESYFGSHLPLLEKVPGIQKTELTRFERTLMGEALYLMAEMFFDDEESLKNALRSPEMEAAGANLDAFAEGRYSLHYGRDE